MTGWSKTRGTLTSEGKLIMKGTLIPPSKKEPLPPLSSPVEPSTRSFGQSSGMPWKFVLAGPLSLAIAISVLLRKSRR